MTSTSTSNQASTVSSITKNLAGRILHNVGRYFVVYLILLGFGAVMVIPFLWMASTACKPIAEIGQVPLQFLPKDWACDSNLNQLYVLAPTFNSYLLNSAFVAVGRTIGQFIMCTLAAYGFARFHFPGRNVLFILSLAVLMMPYHAILIPQFIIVQQIGVLDTIAGIILPNVFSVFSLFLLRQGFLQIPIEVEEAAQLDGANPLQNLILNAIPMSRATITAFIIISLQAGWNDFLWPLIVSSSVETRVATVGLAFMVGDRNVPMGPLMMGTTLTALPVILMFLVLQRQFVRSIAMTGFK
jgi:multiple sugar transport system permease protein